MIERKNYLMLHEPSVTEVWSTGGGPARGERDGVAAVVDAAVEYHAACGARTCFAQSSPPRTELDALTILREKLAGAVVAIDARLREIGAVVGGAPAGLTADEAREIKDWLDDGLMDPDLRSALLAAIDRVTSP